MRPLLSLGFAFFLALTSCATLTGLDDLEKVDCVRDCDSGVGGSVGGSGQGGSGQGGTGGVPASPCKQLEALCAGCPPGMTKTTCDSITSTQVESACQSGLANTTIQQQCKGGTGGSSSCAKENCVAECDNSDCTTCVSSGNCTSACAGSGCDQTCAGSASCAFSCLGGNCDMTCRDSATCGASEGTWLDCAGAGCAMECQDSANCFFNCSGGNCTFRCATTGQCLTQCPPNNCTTE